MIFENVLYSKTSDKGHIGDNINSAVCALCRAFVLFSKVQNVIGKPTIWDLEKCPL